MFLPLLLCQTASLGVPLAPGIAGAIEPQGAFLSDGRMVVAFGTKDAVYCAREKSDGQFEPPVKIDATGLMVGMRRGPRIATTSDSVLITACLQSPTEKRKADLYAFVSRDRGQTWSGRTRVNDAAGSSGEALTALCSYAGYGFLAVWLDNRAGKMELWSSASVDGGRGWGRNVRVYQSPSGSICECCHPSIAVDYRDTVHIMWRNSVDGNRDMYTCETDNMSQFSEAKKIGQGSWKLDACPMDGGSLVAHLGVDTVWRREGTVYLCSVGSSETVVAQGEQPTITRSLGTQFLAWVKSRKGALVLRRPDGGKTTDTVVAEHADDPVLFSDLAGNVGLVWADADGPRALRLRRGR